MSEMIVIRSLMIWDKEPWQFHDPVCDDEPDHTGQKDWSENAQRTFCQSRYPSKVICTGMGSS